MTCLRGWGPLLGSLFIAGTITTSVLAYAPPHSVPQVEYRPPALEAPPIATYYRDLSDLAEVAVPRRIDYDAAIPFLEPVPPLVTLYLPVSRPKNLGKVSLREALLREAEGTVNKTARQLGLHRFTLWCAAGINYYLQKIGLKGTNSDLAASFASYGEPSAKPCVGCIAVKKRRGGNHVVVVKKVMKDKVLVVSPNGGGGRVRLTTYSASTFYAYRIPPGDS